MQFNIKNPQHREKLLCEIVYYIMDMKYTDMKKFLYIPEEYITEGGYPLGRIWAELKEAYNQNTLSEEDIRFLLKIRMQLTDSPQKSWKYGLTGQMRQKSITKNMVLCPCRIRLCFVTGRACSNGCTSRRNCINGENFLHIK